jgi:hypothetical protein
MPKQNNLVVLFYWSVSCKSSERNFMFSNRFKITELLTVSPFKPFIYEL